MQDEMLIVEDVMLMLLDDTSGAIAGAGTLHYTLGGAVLVELALLGRVEIDEDEGGFRAAMNGPVVSAVGSELLEDPILRSALEKVAAKPQRVQPLLLAIGGELRETVLDRLVDRGAIRREKRKVLGFIPSTRMPIDDGRHEEELRLRLAAVLQDEEQPDTRTAAVGALLSASGVLPSLHPQPTWSGTVYQRGKDLEKGSWGAAAVSTSVARTAAAITASSVAVTVAITTSTSGS